MRRVPKSKARMRRLPVSGMTNRIAELVKINAHQVKRSLIPALNGSPEQDVRLSRAAEPGVTAQLLLKLAFAPAGVAKRHQELLGALILPDGFKHIPRGCQPDFFGHHRGVLPAQARRVKHKAPFRLHRPATEYRQVQFTAVKVQLFQNFTQMNTQRLIDHQAQGTIRRMLAQVDDATMEIGVGQPGRRHQNVVTQACGIVDASCHPDVSPRLWNDQVLMISSSSTCSLMSGGNGANGAAIRTIRIAASSSTVLPEDWRIASCLIVPSLRKDTSMRRSP